jgi:hypothetical protein
MIATGLAAVGVVAVAATAALSAEDVRRYLRIRNM